MSLFENMFAREGVEVHTFIPGGTSNPESRVTFENLSTLFMNTLLWYSRVHFSSDEVFSKILKKPSIVQKKTIPHMKAFGLFHKTKHKFFFF